MGIILKLIAIIIGASALEDPKPCDCTRFEQNIMVSPGKDAIVHIFDYGKTKCQLLVDVKLRINSEHMFDEMVVCLVSSRRGILSKQVSTGALEVRIKDQLKLKKNEQIWISISSHEEHLINIEDRRRGF